MDLISWESNHDTRYTHARTHARTHAYYKWLVKQANTWRRI